MIHITVLHLEYMLIWSFQVLAVNFIQISKMLKLLRNTEYKWWLGRKQSVRNNTVNFNRKCQDVENRLIFEARSGTLWIRWSPSYMQSVSMSLFDALKYNYVLIGIQVHSESSRKMANIFVRGVHKNTICQYLKNKSKLLKILKIKLILWCNYNIMRLEIPQMFTKSTFFCNLLCLRGKD